MEALAIVQIISSIVQLVDFGSKCVRTDLEYLKSFARARGMLYPRPEHLARLKVLAREFAKGKFNLRYLGFTEREELIGLLQWLIGCPDNHNWSQKTVRLGMRGNGPAACVAQLLRDMGLSLTGEFQGK
jgi:hypothetical protein